MTTRTFSLWTLAAGFILATLILALPGRALVDQVAAQPAGPPAAQPKSAGNSPNASPTADTPAASPAEVEKVLIAGPFGGHGRRPDSAEPIAKPYQPWKIDWDSYIYKDFYPCLADHHASAAPAGGVPAKELVEFNEGTWGAPVQAAPILRTHLGPFPKGEQPRNHPESLCKISDWRGYQLLRVDAKCMLEDVHLWLSVEDKVVEPPVVGNFDLKPGAWATLQIDLEQAAKDRGLDLANMWAMYIYANPSTKQDVTMKNLRLARRDAKAEFPIVADPNASKLPVRPKKVAPPKPDIPRDATPLDRPITLVYKAESPLSLFSQVKPTVCVAAYDAKHVMMTLVDKSYQWYNDKHQPKEGRDEMFAVQTLDGGKTWTGLDGDKERTWLQVTVRPSSRAIDDIGGAVLWNKDGCGNNPGPRHRLTKFSFLGARGWTCNRKDYVFDSENYHCGITSDGAVRLADGRIWAGFCILHRLFDPSYGTHAMYSDDDGKTWLPWQEGRLAWIPDSRPTWGGQTYVVGCGGERVGVIWAELKGEGDTFYAWSMFDGNLKTWTKPERVYGKYVDSVATVGGKTPLISGGTNYLPGGKSLPGGVKRFDGAKWVQDMTTANGGGPGSLCVCGDSVAAIQAAGGGFSVYWRSPEGVWDAKPETIKVDGPVGDWRVAEFGPPNFAPVLYTPKNGRGEARVLLVPNRHVTK